MYIFRFELKDEKFPGHVQCPASLVQTTIALLFAFYFILTEEFLCFYSLPVFRTMSGDDGLFRSDGFVGYGITNYFPLKHLYHKILFGGFS